MYVSTNFAGYRKGNNVDEEFWVNRFAIAYWKKANNRERLQELKALLEQVIATMTNPVPSGQDYLEFFKKIWGDIWEQDEQQAAMLYAYFQFSCVLEAMKCKDALEDLMREIGMDIISYRDFESYNDKITEYNAENILKCCINNLRHMGVLVSVELELTDNPAVHCVQVL